MIENEHPGSARDLYINGAWVDASDESRFDDHDPWTGEVIASVADASVDDTRAAIDAAAAAQPGWAATGPEQRADLLLGVADEAERRLADLAQVLTAETGSIPSKAEQELRLGIAYLRSAAELALRSHDAEMPSSTGRRNIVTRVPVGVVSVVTAWNVPFMLSIRAVGDALALGNTVVLKPSEESPLLGGLVIAELFDAAGAAPGIANVVTCSRERVPEVGDELVTHERVRAISFTGSEAVGRSIASLAGAHLKRVDLELGGSDACIVLADADLGLAVDNAVFGAFHHGGQICVSTKRLIVEEAIAEEFIARFVAAVQRLQHGDPQRDGVAVGPVINAGQVAKLRAAVDDAVAKGATVACGGSPDGPCFEPTVLTGVTPEMDAYREELFGPVRVIHRVADEDAAVALANDTPYGLAGGVWTADTDRGLAIARRLETGMAHVNGATVGTEPHIPFGGMKSSGIGRHGGEGSIEAFTELRWLSVQEPPQMVPPLFRTNPAEELAS